MDLREISELIMSQVNHNKECGKDDVFTVIEIESIIQSKIANILEPEGVYKKGVCYDGLGRYLGIVDTYPYGEDYFRREHKFASDSGKQTTVDKVSCINTVLIREIKR